MRVRQKELRRTRKRLEERIRAAKKGIAISGTGVAAAANQPRANRPVTSRRSSEATTAPRPQGGRRDDRRPDRGPRRDGGQGGERREQRPPQTAENSAPTPAPAPTEG